MDAPHCHGDDLIAGQYQGITAAPDFAVLFPITHSHESKGKESVGSQRESTQALFKAVSARFRPTGPPQIARRADGFHSRRPCATASKNGADLIPPPISVPSSLRESSSTNHRAHLSRLSCRFTPRGHSYHVPKNISPAFPTLASSAMTAEVVLPDGNFSVESAVTRKVLLRDPAYAAPLLPAAKKHGLYFSIVPDWAKRHCSPKINWDSNCLTQDNSIRS